MKRLPLLLIIVAFLFRVDIGLCQDSLVPESKGEIVKHRYYTLAYSEENEQAYWVYYELTPSNVKGTAKRRDNFRPDPSVKTGSATLADYKNSGYDRGHLCPAADMKINTKAMSETFYMSNMSPQVPGFNRGIWSNVEDQVRKWALEYDTLHIATGPVFKNNKGTIGTNAVTVPGYYYKVIYSPGKKEMIGLVLPNASSSESLDKFVLPVDSVESLTGIDFFSGLQDCVENRLEGEVNVSEWFE